MLTLASPTFDDKIPEDSDPPGRYDCLSSLVDEFASLVEVEYKRCTNAQRYAEPGAVGSALMIGFTA